LVPQNLDTMRTSAITSGQDSSPNCSTDSSLSGSTGKNLTVVTHTMRQEGHAVADP
jgi:hypothetical protein